MPEVPHLRVARPCRDLAAAELFWVAGAGLEVLLRVDGSAEGGHRLLMVGLPGAGWHLELVEDPSVDPLPTEEDLLVLYLGRPLSAQDDGRLAAAGGRRVTARNPYWEQWGRTWEDPDGYRLVLAHRTWP